MPVSPGFAEFMAEAEPRLRRALVARYGRQYGRDATLDAMVYGWQHWDRVRTMANPIGYLYRVGSSRVQVTTPWTELKFVSEAHEPWVEPALEACLDDLTEHQRVAVVLRYSFEWTYEEIADLLGTSVSTVRNHLARGMERLRSSLGVTVDG